ncbi:protein YhfH [Sporosarcina limicola]|uniref:Ribosomal protein L37AE/L43A n=1 Tax=Sporosarcina limicola TaxID=34101 RepID=A0A927RGM4_9BACL|nr:protein YhfH [Sporosarcina limicola]MBE1556652.1 ribosomal protein L37AE/L43A [Sporosarcina limicola]
MQTDNKKNELPKKICRECGCEIVEQVESLLFECERCIGLNEE